MITPDDFEHEPAPDGLHCWRLRERTDTTLFQDAVVAHVLLAQSDDLYDADLSLLTEVLADIDHYLQLALDFVRSRVDADPSFFGLTEPADGRLDQPEVTFMDACWFVRFAEGDFPICDPYGLIVEFAGRDPIDLEGTSEHEEID